MSLNRFDVQLDAGGSPQVSVNDIDVTPMVRRVSVDATVGDVPKVFIETIGDGRIRGEGIVVVADDPRDQRQLVEEFLDNIDPAQLERAALDIMGGFGGESSTGQAFLAVLKGWVGGNVDGT